MKNSFEDRIQELKGKLPVDQEQFPQESYVHIQRDFEIWMSKLKSLLAGSRGWYEQGELYDHTFENLRQINLLLGLFGRINPAKVVEMIRTVQRKIAIELELSEPMGLVPLHTGKKLAPKSSYPRATAGAWKSCLEMNHAFFDIDEDKQIEIRNHGAVDFIHYASDGSELPEQRSQCHYRVPARRPEDEEPPWVPIPPFLSDSRPDVANPKAFTSARGVFSMRGTLDIRLVKKSESHPPCTWQAEVAASKRIEQDRAAEIEDLIAAIKSNVAE